MRPTCSNGNCKSLCKHNGVNVDGSSRYYTLCSGCLKRKYNHPYKYKPKAGRIRSYGKYKKLSFCEYCKFIALDTCQLDVDHIDGNHFNNELSNLQTLCANCHRLKTKLCKNGIYKIKA